MHFAITIVGYLALIRLRLVELHFRQIKIQYNTTCSIENLFLAGESF